MALEISIDFPRQNQVSEIKYFFFGTIMRLLFHLFVFLSLPASAQIKIKGGECYFSNGNLEYRLNQYSLTNKERNRIFSNLNSSMFWDYLNNGDPQKVDLKPYMSRVKNQGQRGSCSTFAAMALVEHFHDNNADYSEQCLAKFSSTQDAATIVKALEYVRGGEIITHGVYLEHQCPYRNPEEYSEWKTATVTQKKELQWRARNDIPEFDFLTTIIVYPRFKLLSFDVEELFLFQRILFIRYGLLQGVPIGASAIVVDEEQWKIGFIDRLPDEEEIDQSCNKTGECVGHGFVFTGFDDERQLLFFKNSWGETWGLTESYNVPKNHEEEKIGYGAMSYEYFLRFGIRDLIFLYH